jgi:uncharacterized protein YecT (DUF1311 family)
MSKNTIAGRCKRQWLLGSTIAALTPFLITSVHSAGFDCSRATAKVLICSSTELSQLDDEATRLYQLALKHPQKAELLAQLREWLKIRNACATVECIRASYQRFLPEFSVNFTGISTTSNSKLAEVFDPEMVGANIAYLEQIVGVARNIYGDVRVYKVDGCEVIAQISRGTVDSLKLYPSAACTFDLNAFQVGGNRLPSLESLTFGAFTKLVGSGQMYASCLSMCGNAAEPTVSMHWQGSRAEGLLEVLIETQLVTDETIDASKQWQAAMERKKGTQWVDDRKFNCEAIENDLAVKAFAHAPVWSITVGRRMPVETCDGE